MARYSRSTGLARGCACIIRTEKGKDGNSAWHCLDPTPLKGANMDHSYKFSVNHLQTSAFRDDGLRPFFQYRDLGIRDATNGAVVAHVIRAKPDAQMHPERHHHEVEFQMVYVLKGWVKFHYEG